MSYSLILMSFQTIRSINCGLIDLKIFLNRNLRRIREFPSCDAERKNNLPANTLVSFQRTIYTKLISVWFFLIKYFKINEREEIAAIMSRSCLKNICNIK